MSDALAVVGGRTATGLVDVTTDLTALDGAGFWAVVVTYEGAVTCARFSDVHHGSPRAMPWYGPRRDAWTTSLDRSEYVERVGAIRDEIAAGEVYQVNLCRVLSAPVSRTPDMCALGAALARGNPAPYAAVVDLPSHDVHVASASPERFLHRDGALVSSDPIKGTAVTA